MDIHEECLKIAKDFQKAVFLGTHDKMIDIINEIAYSRYSGKTERCKELISNYNNLKYEVENKEYKKTPNVVDAQWILENYSGKISLDIDYILRQIGYAESSIKKLLKDFKNEECFEGDRYIIAVLETIPKRSKYRKGADMFISKLMEI